jgi:hypothetical protein
MMSRAIFFAVILTCVGISVGFPATLTNRHLLVNVEDETGRLFLSTTDGLDDVDGDEQQNLLFFDDPPTSYTHLYIDGDVFTFGGDRGVFVKRPVVVGNYIETRWGNELVQCMQTVQWIERTDTGLRDGVLIRYDIENLTGGSLEVGLRILLDTCLGEKQTAHFVLDDGTDVEYETERVESDVPAWWISGEGDGKGPCLRGSLREPLATPPQRVLFANYRSLRLNPVQYRLRPGRRFHHHPYSRNDSAVALFFGPENLEQGEVACYGTILGLCGEGEYVLRGDRSVYDERTVLGSQPHTGEAPDGIPSLRSVTPDRKEERKASREEIDALLRELTFVQSIRGDIEAIDELVAELNEALEGKEKSISEERLREIRRLLAELSEE